MPPIKLDQLRVNKLEHGAAPIGDSSSSGSEADDDDDKERKRKRWWRRRQRPLSSSSSDDEDHHRMTLSTVLVKLAKPFRRARGRSRAQAADLLASAGLAESERIGSSKEQLRSMVASCCYGGGERNSPSAVKARDDDTTSPATTERSVASNNELSDVANGSAAADEDTSTPTTTTHSTRHNVYALERQYWQSVRRFEREGTVVWPDPAEMLTSEAEGSSDAACGGSADESGELSSARTATDVSTESAVAQQPQATRAYRPPDVDTGDALWR